MKKQQAREGHAYAVPLRKGMGFGVCVVARKAKAGVLLGFFFGPPAPQPISPENLGGIHAATATIVEIFGDLGIRDGTWPLIGAMPDWSRAEWPVPDFGRYDPLSGVARRVQYDQETLEVVREQICSRDEIAGLWSDGLSGAGAAEIGLTKALSG